MALTVLAAIGWILFVGGYGYTAQNIGYFMILIYCNTVMYSMEVYKHYIYVYMHVVFTVHH